MEVISGCAKMLEGQGREGEGQCLGDGGHRVRVGGAVTEGQREPGRRQEVVEGSWCCCFSSYSRMCIKILQG